MAKDAWITNVNCQGPDCTKTMRVNGPGELRPGWLLVTQPPMVAEIQKGPIGGQPPKPKFFPFCGFTCLYNWVAARLPSKRGRKE